MEQILNKENDINNSNKQSTLDTNKNSILFFNSGKYFSFGKDNIIDNKLAPNTSSFNIRESLKKPLNNNLMNNNTFLNKKRKLMTSEELELEQIQREREEVKRMMKKNMDLYNRTKSGTTTIVSKIRETIHGLNNLAKNTNNNIINKTSGYSANFLREKAMNKINLINKKINENNMKQEQQSDIFKGKTIEIINTDILPKNNSSANNEIVNENSIELNEEKENTEQNKENEIELNKKNTNKKTPVKENSYLSKIKQLGSMSKLDLYGKIQKYTEICQQVLEEQENGEENIHESEKKQKGKKKKKKSSKK
jgi:hypothetical protein